MGIDFRRFAASIPEQSTEGTAMPQRPDGPPSCSYCGATEFEPGEDNGRVQRVTCAECGGTMVSSDGAYWQPDLIGQGDNHPQQNADPASGGVPGVWAPVLRREDLSDHKAAAVDWCRHRHAERCWLPRQVPDSAVALYQPQDRGLCPWITASQQQINCPVSEPGPMAGMTMAGKKDRPKPAPLKRGLGPTHDPKTCPVCRQKHAGPVRHQGAPVPLPHPNPTGGTSWYHGTDFDPEEDYEHREEHTHYTPPETDLHGNPFGIGESKFEGDPGGRLQAPNHSSWGTGKNAGHHWNTDLGVHFSSLKHVAGDLFANNNRQSRVAHASVHMGNPAHYKSEEELGAHAINWAREQGHRFLPEGDHAHNAFTNGDDHKLDPHSDDPDDDAYYDQNKRYAHVAEHIEPHDEDMRTAVSHIDRHGVARHQDYELSSMDRYLSTHPDREQITEGFRNHLQSKGHDGIVYGNSIEGPKGHACAIAFPDTHVHVKKWEWKHPESEHHVPTSNRTEDWGQHHLISADPREWPGGHKAASRGGLPEDAEFHFTPSPGHPHQHHLEMQSGGASVGYIKWAPRDGDVQMVDTHHQYRHRGIGTALVTKAHELSTKLGVPGPNGSVFHTPDGSGLRDHLDSSDERPSLDHIPTVLHRGKGEDDTSLHEHLIKHHYPTSGDMVRGWSPEQAENVHDKITQFEPCGWQKQASLADPELALHMIATWSEVRSKAKRIRSEGGVNMLVASGEGVGGNVRGDTAVYETMLTYVPGSSKVGFWTCGCAWGAYSWGRSAAYRRFEGRMCSHALAMQFEAQSRGMFGKTVVEDQAQPSWLRARTPIQVEHDRDTGRGVTRRAVPRSNMRRSYEGALDGGVYAEDHGLDLRHPPVYAFAVEALSQGADPADAMRLLLSAGLAHTAALSALQDAMMDPDAQPDPRAVAARTAALRATSGYDSYGEWDGREDDEESQAHTKDWDDIHSGIESLHRGVSVMLHPHDHAIVHDQNRPVPERAHHLLTVMQRHSGEPGIGSHWTPSRSVAEDFSDDNVTKGLTRDSKSDHMQRGDHTWGHDPDGDPKGQPATSVVFHAHRPDRDAIDENPDEMAHGSSSIYGFHDHGEHEVPIHPGSSMALKGVSWKARHDDYDEPDDHDDSYTHHDFGGEGHHVTAVHHDPEDDVWWHGTPTGDLRGGRSGLHVGTHKAATQAVTARIGHPVHGSWDGTRSYGETLLAGKNTLHERGIYPTGHNCRVPDHDHMPDPAGHFPHDSHVTMDSKPDIFPLHITGSMGNTPHNPLRDSHANHAMQRTLEDGGGGHGYFYRNVGEDPGSVSAVLPGREHIERLGRNTPGHDYRNSDRYHQPLKDSDYDFDEDEDSDWHHHGAKAEPEDDGPTHAGLVLKAQDTGRVLMLQRSLEDEDDPARGTWEFPGGGIEPGDASSLHGAAREFAEEIGQRVPHGGTLQHVWRSGPYVGHVMVIPHEHQVTLHDGRVVPNPDDPKGDHAEQAAWWDPDHAKKNPALRPECKTSPWKQIKEASRGKTAGSSDWRPGIPTPDLNNPEHSRMLKEENEGVDHDDLATSPTITRGLKLSSEFHPDVAKRISRGQARLSDLLPHLHHDVGEYWHGHHNSLEDAKDYAGLTEDHVGHELGSKPYEGERGEPVHMGDVGVVLEAHRPKGWDPNKNPDDGLMGNSYLAHPTNLRMHKIHYNDERGHWHHVDATGTTMHTPGAKSYLGDENGEYHHQPFPDYHHATLEQIWRQADFAAQDPLGDFTADPPAQKPNTVPGDQENPGSTGFATAADPPAFDSADARSMRMPDMATFGYSRDGFLGEIGERYAQPHNWPPLTGGDWPAPPTIADMAREYLRTGELHDPEAALPTTTADDDTDWTTDVDPAHQHIPSTPTGGRQDPRDAMQPEINPLEDMGPNSVHASKQSVEDIVAAFQATAGARMLADDSGSRAGVSGSTSNPSDADIAQAAKAHLAKLGMKEFSFVEQQALINEGSSGERARNFGDLKIEGTHYQALDQALAEQERISGDTEILFV